MADQRELLFEPWAMGDALIAASCARMHTSRFVLACDPKWHEILRMATPKGCGIDLVGVQAPYARARGKEHFLFGIDEVAAADTRRMQFARVHSIRGDLRDRVLAQRIFSNSKMHFEGYLNFVAWRNEWVNRRYFRSGRLPILNRYQAWANLLGLDYGRFQSEYPARGLVKAPAGDQAVIHVGSSVGSKQYPYVKEFKEFLESNYHRKVVIAAGPSDALPPGVQEADVVRASFSKLIELFSESRDIFTNDSGPMHLAGYLGRTHYTFALISNIHVWKTPLTVPLIAPEMPLGVKPRPEYKKESVAEGLWPQPEYFRNSLAGL